MYIAPIMNLEQPEYNFCQKCGGTVALVPCEGRARPVCGACGHIAYFNPIPATCQVVSNGDTVLLTRRAVDPGKGLWCLPGGFVEWGEAAEEAARRELREETGIIAEEMSLIGIYSSIAEPDRHVVLIAFEADRWHGDAVPGDDADEVGWFGMEELPPLAFAAHRQVLDEISGRGSRENTCG